MQTMEKKIAVRIKLFSGIDRELRLENYDRAEGIVIHMPSGKKLKWALKSLGVEKISRYAFFRSGERISPSTKVNDGDEISCLKPTGGG
jgi:hypothetical protein